jgi:cellulose biosynthesis protein BcsQ
MPIISLSSFKGGVAKTTSAICLASLSQNPYQRNILTFRALEGNARKISSG